MSVPSFRPARRRLLRAAGAACVAAVAGCGTAHQPGAGPQRLKLLGEGQLPHKMAFRGTTVGGLSGLDFHPGTGQWAALSDDRSDINPARFYTLRLDIVAGQPLRVEPLEVVTLRDVRGQPFPNRRAGGEVVDPEACRFTPDGRGLLWTSEGDVRAGQPPTLREARLDGTHVRDFTLPAMLLLGTSPGTGPRNNETLEGLALTPDGRTAWAAMEGALQQDGPLPKVGQPGGPCRFTAFDLQRGTPVRQIAYIPDAIPKAPLVPGGYADNGVSEVLMLDAQRMLVLERAYMLGVGTSLRIYEIDTADASDTLAQPVLKPGDYRPAAKKLVADFDTVGLSRLDNTEGMAWGPRLANGRRSLVVVSDDNFNPMQVTQFAAFEYLE